MEVDDKYSPKIKLFSIRNGLVGMMKMKKSDYMENPVQVGTIIYIEDWIKKQAYTFENDKPVKRPGVFDIWINKYRRIK